MTAERTELDVQKIVLFMAGDLVCGLEILQVQETIKHFDITAVEHAPPYVRGVINLRGQLLTVIDLRSKLGLPVAEIDAQMRIVVVRGTDGIAGLLVDSVDDVVEVDGNNLKPPPGHIKEIPGVFFSAIHQMETGLAAVLDLNEVLVA